MKIDKLMKRRTFVYSSLLTAIILLLAGCSSKMSKEELAREKHLPPLHLFYNPALLYISEDILPDYANYPNDRMKYGLRGGVKTANYTTIYQCYQEFDLKGNLIKMDTWLDAGRRYGDHTRIQYDENGHLKSDYRDAYTYDANHRLTVREDSKRKREYTYDSAGELLTVRTTPKIDIRAYDRFDLVMNMDVTEDGLVIENYEVLPVEGFSETYGAPQKPGLNKHICTLRSDGATILYKVYSDKSNHKVDSIIAKSEFVYNEKGDVKRWTYDETKYPSGEKNAFFFDYTYEYDTHDNWTKMTLTGDRIKKFFWEGDVKTSDDGTLQASYVRELTYYTDEEIQAEELRQKEEMEAREQENELMAKQPFKGVWRFTDEGERDPSSGMTFGALDVALVLDLYEASIDNGVDKDNGGFQVMGKKEGNCPIISFKIDGNKADITYGDLSGAVYSAQLVYNPEDKSMTYIDGELKEKDEEVEDWMVNEFHMFRDRMKLDFVKRL